VLAAGCTSHDASAPKGQSEPPDASHSGSPSKQTVEEASTPPASPLAATVGPLRITLEDVLKVTRESEKGAHPPHAQMTVADVRKNIRKAALDPMIERRLLILGALEHPEWVTDASAEQEVQRQLVSLGPDEVERRRKLANVPKGMFMDQFRRYVREEMMKREVLQHEVTEKVSVSAEEIRKRYEEKKEEVFHRPESWAVYHVDQYLPREKASELPALIGSLEVLRSEASHLIEKAPSPKAKADLFAPFVRKHSQAPDSQTGYAYIYDDPKVQFDPAFLSRVKEATLGELSPVFELAGDDKKVGACFFLVFERNPGVYTDFEHAEHTTRADLLKEKSEAVREALFERLRAEYPVKIFEDTLGQGTGEAIE
jgi:hypothetical protein